MAFLYYNYEKDYLFTCKGAKGFENIASIWIGSFTWVSWRQNALKEVCVYKKFC